VELDGVHDRGKLPKDRDDLAIQRILFRHDFSHDLGDLLLADYERAIEHLGKHPGSMTADDASGFHH
jgi:glutamate decarboxylase